MSVRDCFIGLKNICAEIVEFNKSDHTDKERIAAAKSWISRAEQISKFHPQNKTVSSMMDRVRQGAKLFGGIA